MFDLTPEIKLESKYQKTYRWLRILAGVVFIFGFLYFGYLSFFPAKNFFFSFANPSSPKNTIIINAEFGKKDFLSLDAILPASEGNFSEVEVDVNLDKKSSLIKKGEILLAKSYLSFFYPLDDPVKTEAEDRTGFSDGTLISYGGSVFIVSGNEILPINNPADFESMGFDWNDVIPVSGEEIGMYEKGRLFTANRAHPDGTIFADKKSGRYYLVQNGTKRELVGSDVIKSYLKKNPVLVDEEGLLKKNDCQLKEKFSIFGKSYSCVIAIENLSQIPGNDYRFESAFSPDIKIKEARIIFRKTIDWKNFRSVFAEIKQRIIARYYGQSQQ